MKIIKPADIKRILEVTDRLLIHREGVSVPLDLVEGGHVVINRRHQVEITAPDLDFETFLIELPSRINALDLTQVKRV